MKKALVSLVLVFALLSTCVFSAVFASYSASDTKTITATVSAFGINTVTVNANESVKLDPNGSGVLASATITGTPEVDVTVSFNAVLTFAENSFMIPKTEGEGEELYCPIIFIVNGAEYKIGGTYTPNPEAEAVTIATLADLKAAVEWAVSQLPATKEFTAGQTVNYENLTIVSWKWNESSDNLKNQELGSADNFTLRVTASVVQK